MKIKPSKRPKKRYIVFESDINNDSAVYNAIKKSAANILGENYAEAGIRFIKNKYKYSLHRGVVRVNNKYTTKMVDAINQDKSMKTIGISGILKKAEEKYLKKSF